MRIKNTLSKKSATPLKHARRPGSREQFFNSAGDLNASSNADVMRAIATIMAEAQAGRVTVAEEVNEVTAAEHRAYVAEAFANRSSRDWADMGAALAADLSETVARDGFMRKLLLKQEISQGNEPRHRVQVTQTTAVVSAGVGITHPQFVRDKYIRPPEFPITARLMVSNTDINQSPGDILDEKYDEGLQAIMVGEDRALKTMLDKAVGIYNPVKIISGGLIPATVSNMSTTILTAGAGQGGPILMAADYWEDIQSNTTFAAYYDPVTKLELIQTGLIGRFFGRDFITDGVRHPALKVLNVGEIYVLAQPNLLGAYTERGPVQSTELDGALTGVTGRGWFFSIDESMAIHNAAGVVKGVRA